MASAAAPGEASGLLAARQRGWLRRTPVWVRISVSVALVLVAIVLVTMLLGAGQAGTAGRHGSGGGHDGEQPMGARHAGGDAGGASNRHGRAP